jgi:hypothetical protein
MNIELANALLSPKQMINYIDNRPVEGIIDDIRQFAVEIAPFRKTDQPTLDLVTALTDQTKAIKALVESNQRLIMILADGAMDEDMPAQTYMDGTRI